MEIYRAVARGVAGKAHCGNREGQDTE